jgi:nucleotide-binding universal stress UspA family protein
MMKGIICTVDFSESSRDALKWSVSLAKLLNASLTVLYTYRLLNSANGEATDLKTQIEDNARKNFAALERDILSGCGVPYEFKVEVGFVSNRVKHYAKNDAVSFVVMGNKMNTSNKETFDELAEAMAVPLVIVP